MTMGIYGIFMKDQCLYIGESSSIERRFYKHKRMLLTGKHTNHQLQEWFTSNEMKVDNLSFQILEIIEDEKELHSAEVRWFEKRPPIFFGQIPTGNSKWYVGMIFTKEVREKLSKATSYNKVLEAPYGRNKAGRILKMKHCLWCNSEFHTADNRVRFCSLRCGALNQHYRN